MFNEDLLLFCTALWKEKDQVKQYLESDDENAMIGCLVKAIDKIEKSLNI